MSVPGVNCQGKGGSVSNTLPSRDVSSTAGAAITASDQAVISTLLLSRRTDQLRVALDSSGSQERQQGEELVRATRALDNMSPGFAVSGEVSSSADKGKDSSLVWVAAVTAALIGLGVVLGSRSRHWKR